MFTLGKIDKMQNIEKGCIRETRISAMHQQNCLQFYCKECVFISQKTWDCLKSIFRLKLSWIFSNLSKFWPIEILSLYFLGLRKSKMKQIVCVHCRCFNWFLNMYFGFEFGCTIFVEFTPQQKKLIYAIEDEHIDESNRKSAFKSIDEFIDFRQWRGIWKQKFSYLFSKAILHNAHGRFTATELYSTGKSINT